MHRRKEEADPGALTRKCASQSSDDAGGERADCSRAPDPRAIWESLTPAQRERLRRMGAGSAGRGRRDTVNELRRMGLVDTSCDDFGIACVALTCLGQRVRSAGVWASLLPAQRECLLELLDCERPEDEGPSGARPVGAICAGLSSRGLAERLGVCESSRGTWVATYAITDLGRAVAAAGKGA